VDIDVTLCVTPTEVPFGSPGMTPDAGGPFFGILSHRFQERILRRPRLYQL